MAAGVFTIYARGTLYASCARSNAIVATDCNIGITFGLDDYFLGGFLFGLEGMSWREFLRTKDSLLNFARQIIARLQVAHGLYYRTVLWVLYGQIGFQIGPMLFELFKLRGGGTGKSTITAVAKYDEVMGVVA